MAEENQEASAAPAPKAKPKIGALLENKVVLLGLIVIAQALTALAVTKFVIAPRLLATTAVSQASADGHGAEGEAEPAEGEIVGLEEMIVSLQGDAGAPHYLRTNVGVEVADVKIAKIVEERKAQLRDIVIMTLSSRTAAELLEPDGKESARREILRRLGEKLPPDALLNIYFSDLMIQ